MRKDKPSTPIFRRGTAGQSLVEYALIAALVMLALIAALIATGPAIGDVFSNSVASIVGGDPGGVEGAPTDFWKTVTWIAQQTPLDDISGTNVPAIASDTPIGYFATDPPPLPSDTVIPSPTFTPSHTPEDESWELTYKDSADAEDWYRLTSNTYVGLQAWTARYYQDNLSGSVEEPLEFRNLRYTTSYYQEPGTEIFFTPSTDIPRITERWFSVQLRREIWISRQDARLNFQITNVGGGVRLYYQDNGVCKDFEPGSNARGSETTSPCMIIDEWNDAPQAELSGAVTFPYDGSDTFTGPYVLYLEYYNRANPPNLNLNIESARINDDDDGLNGEPVSCHWGRYEGDRSNVRPFAWNSAMGLDGNNFPRNQKCHLELRGYIELTPNDQLVEDGGPTTPTLTFWHIWDLNSDTSLRLEVGSYNPTPPEGESGRPDTWNTVWQKAGGTRNYEWTQEEVPLTDFSAGDTIAYRFVMESGQASGRRRWYVDDIRVGSKRLPDLTQAVARGDTANSFGICGDTLTCNSYWSFDGGAGITEPDGNNGTRFTDFRTTGRWALTANGAHTGSGIGDDPGQSYSLEQGADQSSTPLDRRIYWIEFDKRINVANTTPTGAGKGTVFISNLDTPDAAPPDEDGDAGPPIISFWHSYNIRDNVALQVQYYDEDASEWRLLREIVRTTDGTEAYSSPSLFQVALNEREVMNDNMFGTGVYEGYEDGWTAWADGGIRVRFAMVVNENAIGTAENAWTIDDIEIERLDNLTYTRYPFGDSGGDEIEVRLDDDTMVTQGGNLEDSLNRWLRTGAWAITEEDAYTGQYTFSDSPNGDYVANSDTTLELRSPIDLNSDTEDNPFALGCVNGPTVTCEAADNRDPAADEPVLSFWWYREIANGGRFTVEIRTNGGANAPITVWEYSYNSNNWRQPAWERTEIDLTPFIIDDAVSFIEDDIVVVFRLDATGNTTARGDGVIIDDIRIENREPERTFRLWIGDGSNDVEGDGNRFVDSIDERTPLDSDDDGIVPDDTGGRWWHRWYRGGDWYSDFYGARSGSQVFHESPPQSEDPFDENESYRYERRSFNVLEMVRTIDMTGLETSRSTGDPEGIATGSANGSPLMYWWQRLDRGDDSRLLVQVAVRQDNPPDNRTTNPLTYGADELHGWGEWQTIYMTDDNEEADYAWVREGVNLANAPIYDSNGNVDDTENFIGEEIRVRFVLDASDVASQDDVRDGWFIDDVTFTTEVPEIIPVPFVDSAESMRYWVAEGTWGLDAAKYRGGAQVPQFPGANGDPNWTARYVNCNYRPDTGSERFSPNNNGCNGAERSNEMLTLPLYRSAYGTFNSQGQWYKEATISTLAFDFDFDDYGGRPPETPNGYTWQDDFAAEYQRTIVVSQPRRYQFYTRSDDGVRVGITPFPTTAEIRQFTATSDDTNVAAGLDTYTDPNINNGNPINYNNIINSWIDRGATVDTASLSLVPDPTTGNPRTYYLTVQYYENGGGAKVAFGISGLTSSFADSPVLVPPEDPDNYETEPANYLSNTSLILDGLLDLRTARKPIINFFTQYDMNNIGARAYIEVSTDGGFTWTRDDLTGRIDYPGGSINANSNTDWGGYEDEWEERTNTLENYAGEMISLRFRLKVDGTRAQQENRQRDGLYITDILIFDLQPTDPAPRIVVNPPISLFVSRGEAQRISVVASGTQPLRYEWFQLDNGAEPPPEDNPGTPGTAPVGSTAVGDNSETYTPPRNLEPGLYRYWVRVSNTISDNDPAILPAVSTVAEYWVQDCIPADFGDCNIYRLNVNGPDLTTRDNTTPNWFGDEESASSYQPIGGFDGNDPQIQIPNISTNEFIQAAISGAAPEDLYRDFHGTGGNMRWNFPIDAGQYTIRLYMAAPYSSTNQGRFTARVNGTIANYRTGGGAQALNNVDFMNLVNGENRTAAVIELEAVTVTPEQSAIDLELVAENRNTYLSGVEIFPVTSLDPVIIQHPQDTKVAQGDTAQLEVIATGDNLCFQWYRGTKGDTGNPVNPTPICVDDPDPRTYNSGNISVSVGGSGLQGTSILTQTNVTSNSRFWALVTGGPDTNPNQAVQSESALISACSYDPNTPGSCGYWYINIAGDTDIPVDTDNDGTNDLIWLRDTGGQPWSSTNLNSRRYNDLNGFTYSGPVSEDFIPRDVYRNYGQDNGNFSMSLDVPTGTYNVTVYVADPNNDTRRSMEISIEGTVVTDAYPDGYHPVDDCGGSVFCAVTFENIEVLDTALEIYFDTPGSKATRVNALSIEPS